MPPSDPTTKVKAVKDPDNSKSNQHSGKLFLHRMITAVHRRSKEIKEHLKMKFMKESKLLKIHQGSFALLKLKKVIRWWAQSISLSSHCKHGSKF